MRIIDDNCPFWITRCMNATGSLSMEIVSKDLILLVRELANIGCSFLHHFHGALNGLHMFSIFYIHPIDWAWKSIHLDIWGSIVVKYPFFMTIWDRMPNGERHVVLLPNIIVGYVFDARLGGGHIRLVEISTRKVRLICSSHICRSIWHNFHISETIHSFFPVDQFSPIFVE